MRDLHVIGGQQRSAQGMRELDDSWYGYGKGVVVSVENGQAAPVLDYQSAPGTCGKGDPELFKSATLHRGRVYACTQTELLVYSYPDFELIHHVSHPVLNDVHHVVPGPGGSILAAVSGHDLVVKMSTDGEMLQWWGVDGVDPTDRIDSDCDYRINCNLKPHKHHPNYLFHHPDGELWVTRFEKRDAVQVSNVERRIEIGRERCHDGVVHDDGHIYFTTVDGYVVQADPESLQVVAEHELAGSQSNTLLGWCRGLTFVDDMAIVGFSRIRHTKVRGTLSWVRNGLTNSQPTRISVYDPATWKLVDEVDVEPAGCNAVFSVLCSQDDEPQGSK